MRRRRTSMPPCELSLLIHPWVLLRLMFLGWYSVPLFLVRTCWYCHWGCWNTPEPSACKEIGPDLEIWGLAADLGTIQLLKDLRWEVPAWTEFPTEMLWKSTDLLLLIVNITWRHNKPVIALRLSNCTNDYPSPSITMILFDRTRRLFCYRLI